MQTTSDTSQTVRFAKTPHLWALSMGAVISSNFFGWQAALIGGFYGLLICFIPVTIMYSLLSLSIAEMATALPDADGPYAYALYGIGPKAAYFAGIAEALKVILTCTIFVVGIGSYISEAYDIDSKYDPLLWIMFYGFFLALNASGVKLSFRFQVLVAVLSLGLLILFYCVVVISGFNFKSYVAGGVTKTWELPEGIIGVLKSLSFTMWFFLGVEEMPLAVEEAINPTRDIPRALTATMVTLIGLALCTTIFSSTIYPGAYGIFQSSAPLLDGFETVFQLDKKQLRPISWILLVGLISSFRSFLCMGWLLGAISRDCLLPTATQYDNLHTNQKTEQNALVVGCAIGLIVAIILYGLIGKKHLVPIMINLALIGALISYIYQLVSFIALRRKYSNNRQSYRSIFGVTGAILAIILCFSFLCAIVIFGIQDADYIASVVFAALYFIVSYVLYCKQFRVDNFGADVMEQYQTCLVSYNENDLINQLTVV